MVVLEVGEETKQSWNQQRLDISKKEMKDAHKIQREKKTRLLSMGRSLQKPKKEEIRPDSSPSVLLTVLFDPDG